MSKSLLNALSVPQKAALLAELAQLSAEPTLQQIQEVMIRYGITSPTAKDGIPSNMAARTLRDGAFADYLEELKAKREAAETVAAIAQNGLSLTDAAASAFAAKVFDASISVGVDEIGGKKANNISLAISRLKTGDQRDEYLEAKIAEIQQKMDLREFDAVQAAIAHANEIKAINADKSLDGAARTERVRQLLFGQKPADFKPVTDKGAQAE